MSDLPVLVVDDNEFIRASMIKFLESNKYKVEGASNGDQALKMLEDKNYAIMITDILMPGTDGFDLVDRLRELPYPIGKTPVIAISGGGRKIDAASALSALEGKADVILKKPFSKKDLLTKVAQYKREAEVAFVG